MKLPKRDRFGFHIKIETIILEMLVLAITAALQTKDQKAAALQGLRIQIEVAKQLIRLEQETNIINEQIYWQLQSKLQEISKMAAGWAKYAT